MSAYRRGTPQRKPSNPLLFGVKSTELDREGMGGRVRGDEESEREDRQTDRARLPSRRGLLTRKHVLSAIEQILTRRVRLKTMVFNEFAL